LGIGDWGLGIGDWGLGPIPNPQSPIPINLYNKYNIIYFYLLINAFINKIYIPIKIINIK